MFNIYSIQNTITTDEYIGYTELPLNKVWRDTLQKFTIENSSLYSAMRHYGIKHFRIRPIEEYYGNDIEDKIELIKRRRNCTYNQDILEHKYTPAKKPNIKKKWGIQKKKKPSPKHETNTIKCRSLETGKLKTLHGWKACAKFCNGDITNIKKAVRRGGTAYGYKWWIYKKARDSKRKVYGIHKETGHCTPIFESISEAMRSVGESDRGKGICTSIKYGLTWRGYKWYYSE